MPKFKSKLKSKKFQRYCRCSNPDNTKGPHINGGFPFCNNCKKDIKDVESTD